MDPTNVTMLTTNATMLTTIGSIEPTTQPEIAPGINNFTCFLIIFAFGAISAVIAKTISAPIERVKIVIQCLYKEQENEEEEALNFNPDQNKPKLKFGVISTAKYIYKNEGILSFWRGNLANCIRYIPKFSFDMTFKENLKGIFKNLIQPGDDFGLTFLYKWIAGVTASFCSTVICYPLDFVRTKMAADLGKDKSERQFTGIIDTLRKTIKQEGCLAIYSGLLVTLIGDVVYRGTKYGLYDGLKDPSKNLIFGEGGASENAVLRFFYYFLFGWFVSAFAGIIAFPFDTVRRIMMVEATKEVKEHRNFIDCFKNLYRQYGLIRFWRGTVANIIRSWSSGLVLAIFDTVTRAARNNASIDHCWNLYD